MDIVKSFMVNDGLARGVLIAADGVVDDIWKRHTYPAVLRPVLAEAVTVALALSAGFKYDGLFSVQIRGGGPVSSLFVDVTQDKKVRAYAVYEAERMPETVSGLADLFGQAQMIFSVGVVGQEPYQGVIAITKASLAETAADYFALSEQIPTQIVIRRLGDSVRCLLVQEMPEKPGVDAAERADIWETVGILAASVRDDELFSETLTPDAILFRLFHANQLVVYPAVTPVFSCRCYRGRMEKFLRQMPAAERTALYQNGQIEVACQFCGEKYIFTPDEFGDVIG